SFFGRRPRRRVRLDGNVLSLIQDGFGGSARGGSIDASGGVFVAVGPLGPRGIGSTEAVVRIVSADGALEVLLADVARTRHFKRRLVEMLQAASVGLLERTTPLQGGIHVRAGARGEDLEWKRRR